MIHIENFTKKYRKQIAVDNISMDIYPGEITLLLGPNGAGKSTTVKSITGLLNYEGMITICNYPNKSLEAKRLFGYVAESPSLYDLLTVEEHIHFIAKAYDLGSEAIERANIYLDKLELMDQKNKLARELSKGMMQKVSICLALMTDPEVILFDEPMIGLDPKAIENLIELLLNLKNNHKTIFISTHIIDLFEDIWDKVYIMNKGRIATLLRKEEFVKQDKNLKQMFLEITSGGIK